MTTDHHCEDLQAVEAKEHRWRQAWTNVNYRELDEIHSDRYTAINYLGETHSKLQIMEDVKSGLFRYQSMEHHDVSMRWFGGVVIVVARSINKGYRGERDVSGEFRYTRVYAKEAGDWRAVHSHYTKL